VAFPFSVGALSVLEPTRPPTPKLVGEIVARERPTLFFCIPTFYAALLASDLPDDTFASVRYAVSAAEPLPAETYQRFLDRFGVQILDGIGSTELTHIFISNRGGVGGVRPGSSGTPVDGYQARLVDEDGRDVPDGEPGHLLAAGPSMASGYWCRTEQNRRTFLGEWMRTGDMYIRSADGFYTYLGRSDDMLKVGGEWVSPAEVEAVLIEHAAVLEAAVVGRRDGDGVVRPVAWVVPAAGAVPSSDVLEAHCRGRLAGYKRPKTYEFVGSLPKTATGKIQRFKLR
jgi:benzoate-CoA ligase